MEKHIRLEDGSIKEDKVEMHYTLDLIPEKHWLTEYIPRTIHKKKDIEILKSAYDNQMNVLLMGPTGIGKNALVRAFCAKYNLPYFRVNLHGNTVPEDLVGQNIPKASFFEWCDGVLTRMMRDGGVLVCDEINACPPEITFILHSVLDDERKLVLTGKDGEVVRAHKNFMFVATMNPDYAGVREMNQALRGRFHVQLPLRADSKVENKLIKDKRILSLAKTLRNAYTKGQLDVEVGTRELLILERNIELFGLDLALEMFTARFGDITSDLMTMICEIKGLTPNLADGDKLKEIEDDKA